MEIGIILFISAAAFLAGLIDSIAGGGGLISMPALLAVGVPAQMALGTNKFQSMFGTAAAVINFHRNEKIVWKAALMGVPMALVGSAVGAKLALIIPSILLAKILVIALPPAAIAVFASKSLIGKRGPYNLNRKAALLTMAACFTIGLYDGFFGPGTGTFLIVALVMFSGMGFANASATAKAFNLASSVGAFAVFLASGQINYIYGLAMAVANIFGNLIGSHLTIRHGDEFVRKILMVSLSLLFIYLVAKYFL